MSKLYSTQNDLLMKNLMAFYDKNNNLDKILKIINGESQISLRLIDWFATNYSKKNFTVIEHIKEEKTIRTKVYVDYKLKLKAYSKKRFDPFCRWERINIPYKNDSYIQTTIGQLNFFRWALEYGIIDYIKKNFKSINQDMNKRNSTSKNRKKKAKNTRKKREELSVSASKTVKKEHIEIIVKFN
jgi:hypothetical protein